MEVGQSGVTSSLPQILLHQQPMSASLLIHQKPRILALALGCQVGWTTDTQNAEAEQGWCPTAGLRSQASPSKASRTYTQV